MTTRLIIAALGLVAGGYGLITLLNRSWSDLISIAIWLAGGVVVHDFILAPIILALVAATLIVLPQRFRAVGAFALIVIGTVTIVAIPVLGRFGALPDNPTLLPRNYGAGWLVFVGVVAVACAAWAIYETRRRPAGRHSSNGSDPAPGDP